MSTQIVAVPAVQGAKKERWSVYYIINMTLMIGVAWYIAISLFSSQLYFGLDEQPAEKRCLDARLALIRRKPAAIESLARGDIVSMIAKGNFPIPDGLLVMKKVAGLPGDLVVVEESGIQINGKFWGPLNRKVMQNANKTLAGVVTRYRIPKGKILLLGDQPRTYDGRYFGPIDESQLRGKSWIIF